MSFVLSPRCALAAVLGSMLLVGCGDTGSGVDASTDARVSTDGAMVDAGGVDGGLDAGRLDAGGVDGGPDAGAMDAGAMDAGALDAGALDAGALDAGPFTLPASCTDDMACGPDADCAANSCVCRRGSLPCLGGCCPLTVERNIELGSTGGHAPEIGADAAGNVYVLFQTGSEVRMATIVAGAAVAMVETITTSSSESDAIDFAVAPDGAIHIVVHKVGARGYLELYSRASGEASFGSMILAHAAYRFSAGVSIARAPNGDLYVATAERFASGTMGLSLARFDAAGATWLAPTTLMGSSAHQETELHARTDGFYVGTQFTSPGGLFGSYDVTPTTLTTLTAITGDAAAVMNGAEQLYTFTGDRLRLSDDSVSEVVPNAGITRSNVDMSLDADSNPVLVFHDVVRDEVAMLVRMPLGGFARFEWFDFNFVPAGVNSEEIMVDTERLPSGNIAFVGGDLRDRGAIRYFEISR